jgi:hypothetical protein
MLIRITLFLYFSLFGLSAFVRRGHSLSDGQVVH